MTTMQIIKREKITFYIKDESIVVSNNDFQFLSYNVYAALNRNSFNQFREKILASTPPQYSSIVDVVVLAEKCGIYGVGTARPNLDNTEHEYLP